MIAAIIQARTGSNRLPNKVLMEVKGKPLLWYVINRLKKSTQIEDIIVATSTKKGDSAIKNLCDEWQINCFQGSEDDVLDRYYKAATEYNLDTIVRITADCPLIDFRVVDESVKLFFSNNYHYVSNSIKPSFPDGIDVAVLSYSALKKAWEETSLKSDREHVVPYIHFNSTYFGKDIFKSASYEYESNFSHIRLCVDEKEDFEVVKFLIENSDPDTPWLGYVSLLTKNPDIMEKNSIYSRDEGYAKSLIEDKWDNTTSNMSNCMKMQTRAKKRIPGMTQILSKRPDQFSLGVWPAYFSKAKGSYVWDLDGNKYLDMSIGGIGANVLGYADPDVDAAVSSIIRMGTSSSLNCPEEIELADTLCEIHPWADKVRYARTGGESMAVAVRIARACTGKDKIAFCGYHGWHDWYLSANLKDDNALQGHLLPGLSPIGVPRALAGTALPFHYNNIEELQDIVNKNSNELAAIVMEPIRNIKPEPGFLESVREIADKSGCVLIIDEISAAFRMNSGGAHLLYDFEPDIAVFAKALGNGYPIGAIIGKNEIMEAAQSSFISSSNWTERIGPTAALATIAKFQEFNVGKHLVDLGTRIQSGWDQCARENKLNIQTGGIKPLSHFVFQHEKALEMKALFVQLMLEKGFLASNIYYAMYTHSDSHVDIYLEAVNDSFHEIRNAKNQGNIHELLKGKPSVSGFKRLT